MCIYIYIYLKAVFFSVKVIGEKLDHLSAVVKDNVIHRKHFLVKDVWSRILNVLGPLYLKGESYC